MRALVVGGGVAGLTAALALRRAGWDVTVVEASSRVGGKLRTGTLAGAVVEEGADAFLWRQPDAVALARSVGLDGQLEHPATGGVGLWTRGALHPLPPRTLLGVPSDLGALGRSGVLSGSGLARVPLDLVLPRTRVTEDVPVGWYVGRRLGREVVHRLVDPMLGGVYAGHADRLSLDATMPALAAAARTERSLLAAARRSLPPPTGEPVFAGLHGGLTTLVEAMTAAGGADVRTGLPARALHRLPDGGWRVVCGPVPAPTAFEADAVVLALPARPASRLLAEVLPAAAGDLARVEYASVALVALAFRRADLPVVPSGSGLMVPSLEGLTVKAATFVSNKWPRVAAAAPEMFVVRASVGRHGEEADVQRDDADLVAAVRRDLARVAGLAAVPVEHRVFRWGGALPQYAVGHRDLVRRVRAAVATQPRLAVCGAAYDGVGVPAVVRSGLRAAEEVRGDGSQWGA